MNEASVTQANWELYVSQGEIWSHLLDAEKQFKLVYFSNLVNAEKTKEDWKNTFFQLSDFRSLSFLTEVAPGVFPEDFKAVL